MNTDINNTELKYNDLQIEQLKICTEIKIKKTKFFDLMTLGLCSIILYEQVLKNPVIATSSLISVTASTYFLLSKDLTIIQKLKMSLVVQLFGISHTILVIIC